MVEHASNVHLGSPAGYGLETNRLRNLVQGVIGLVFVCIVISIVIQNIGIA